MSQGKYFGQKLPPGGMEKIQRQKCRKEIQQTDLQFGIQKREEIVISTANLPCFLAFYHAVTQIV